MSRARRAGEGASARRRTLGFAAAAALALGAALAASASAPDPSRPRAGVTSLRFSADVLADLGMELLDVAETGAALRDGALGFALEAPASALALAAAGDDVEGFADADLRHAGGFALRVDGSLVDLAGFRLTGTAAPGTLALRDLRGRRWLLVDKAHALLVGDRLSLSNADLLIAPELAALLGRADLVGRYVGVLDAQLSLEREPQTAPLQALGDACVGDFAQPVDLELVELEGLSQAAREPGGRVAVAPSATVRNLGPGDVQWFRAIAPASPVGPHPYLALHFYRLSGGVLEQIGRADLKHAFFAANVGCACPGGHVLYAGCDDVYGISTNLDRANLAPRDEIDPLTLAWTSLGSHFDGVPVDDVRDHGGDAAHDAFEHRLVVREPDLQDPEARYFYEGWYLAPLDVDLENSMGHREVAPAFAGSTWSFVELDAAVETGSILDVLVDPEDVGPGEATELHDTGEGRVHLAVVTRPLGGGVFHYEYALLNFDFARQVRSVSLPVGAGRTVSNVGFGDANGDPLDDWDVSVTPSLVTWTAPTGNALDWGTLYNFRMDVDAAPAESRATLTPLEAGSPAAITVRTLPEPGVGASAGAALAAVVLTALARLRRPAEAQAGSDLPS